MFQNLSDQTVKEEVNDYQDKTSQKNWGMVIRNILTIPNIILYMISAMASAVSIMNGLDPFGIAIFAAACSNGVMAFPIFIATLIGTFWGMGKTATLLYGIIAVVFLGLLFLKKPKVVYENDNEHTKLGMHLMVAIFLVQIMQIFSQTFLVADFVAILMQCFLAFIFYKIFVNAMPVIRDIGKEKIFSPEEAIGACLMVTIALGCFGNSTIAGFSISHILCTFLVLLLGWQNGILLGTTTGVTLAVGSTVLGFSDPYLIAVYAICGMMAGILSRWNKVGVLIGLGIVGVGIIYGQATNYTYVHEMQEILIAMIGLLFVPKGMQIPIEQDINPAKMFPVTKDRRLGENKEAIEKLNTMSETIKTIAKSYDEAAATVVEDQKTLEQNRQIFKRDLAINLENLTDNILYDDMVEYDNGIVDDIFNVLLEKSEIDNEDLIRIFEQHNSYINVGIEDDEIRKRVEKNIFQVVKAVNYTYEVSKINFIWKQKVSENHKTMSEQLEKVSQVIESLADDMQQEDPIQEQHMTKRIQKMLDQQEIRYMGVETKRHKNNRWIIGVILEEPNQKNIHKVEEILKDLLDSPMKYRLAKEDIQIFETADKFQMRIGVAKTTKQKNTISGDSDTSLRLKDGKYLVALSDGMGSGSKANHYSQMAIQMLENLFVSGFDKKVSLELINSALAKNDAENTYATLDIAVLDLLQGNMEFMKLGACPTYVKTGDQVMEIQDKSAPAGMLMTLRAVTYDKDLEAGDLIVMCTDGVLDSKKEDEQWLRKIIQQIQRENPQEIADMILREAIDNDLGRARDDMTVMVIRIENN